MARLTTAMTAGSLDAEQVPVSSCMSARPWDALAVKVRTPVDAGTDHSADRGVLRLGGDIGCRILLLVDQRRNGLDDRRLRRDRIRGDELNLGAHNAVGNSGVAVKSLDNTHNYSPSFTQSASSTKSMAFFGHSVVQMPQPLQYV